MMASQCLLSYLKNIDQTKQLHDVRSVKKESQGLQTPSFTVVVPRWLNDGAVGHWGAHRKLVQTNNQLIFQLYQNTTDESQYASVLRHKRV